MVRAQFTVAALWATTLAAQPPEPVERVVVSAPRSSPLSVASPGPSIHVVSSAAIRAKQYRSVYEAVREAPGVDVVATAPGQTASLFVRGAKSEQVLVLVDGVELNDPTDPGRGADLGTLRLDGIERVEVIRGAQSVRYPGVGAVVNVVTQRPGGDRRWDVAAEGGSFGSWGAAATTRGSGVVDYAVTGGYHHTDGISAAAGGSERDGSRTTTASARLGRDLGPTTRVEVVTRFSHSRTDLDLAPVDVPDFRATQRNWTTRASVSAKRGAWEPSFALSLRLVERDSVNASARTPMRFDTSGAIQKVEIANGFRLDDSHRLTWAVEAERQAAHVRSEWGTAPKTLDQRVGQGGTYLELERFAADGWMGNAGARLDHHSAFGWQPTVRVAPAYRVGSTGSTLRLAAGNGFKAPSMYQLYGEYGSAGLRPETSLSVEMGIQQELGGSGSVAFLTAFHNRFRDMVDFDTRSGRYFNIGSATTRGVELGFEARLGASWKWMAAYTWLEARDDVSGLALLRRPAHRLSQGIIFAPGSWEIALTHQWVGPRDDLDASSFSRKRLAPYGSLGISAGFVPWRGGRLSARVENALNARYTVIDGYATPGAAGYVGIRQEL